MTEMEMRRYVVSIITKWIGAQRGDATHKSIIDTYNSYLPHPRGYAVTYQDNWCAATVSAVSIKAGLTDIMPVECSCMKMIELYQKLGRWVEDDSYIPMRGDLLMYSWNDTGDGDWVGPPNHVGIVTDARESSITVIEGNKGSASVCGYRTIPVNGRYIRGFCCPDYAKKVREMEERNSGMSKKTAVIPLNKIKKISIEFGNGRTLEQVKAATGCDFIMNGGFYSGSNKPVGHLKVNGTIYARESWGIWGYGWDSGSDIEMGSIPAWQTKANYIVGVELVNLYDGKNAKLSYLPEVGGVRGRTAMGLSGGNLVLYCSGDGSTDAKTPEALRDELLNKFSVDTAIMLDCGGSSQCDFNGEKILSSRKVNNYICVWVDSTTEEPLDNIAWTHTVTTKGSTLNIRSGAGTECAKLGFYNNGDKVAIIEQKNGWGRTDKGWVSMVYLTPIRQESEAKKEVPWYAEAQNWAKDEGITNGESPDAQATRAEVWQMLYNYYKTFGK